MGILSGLTSIFRQTPAREPAQTPARKPAPPRGAQVRRLDMNDSGRLTEDWFSSAMTPDQLIYGSLAKSRDRAQQLEANDDMVRRYLRVMAMKVVGPEGFNFQPLAGDFVGGKFIPDAVARGLLADAWKDFNKAGNSDVGRTMSGVDRQVMTLVRRIVDGEVIKRYWPGYPNKYRFAVEYIDPARLDHMLNREPGEGRNRITMGVEVDAYGAPVAYHFLPEARGIWGSNASAGPHQRVEAQYIRHIFRKERPGQTRGITELAPAALRKHLLSGLEKALVVGTRVAASKMGFITNEGGDDFQGDGVDENGNTIIDAVPGSFTELGRGQKLMDWSPEFPSQTMELIRSMKQDVSAGMGISYATASNDLTGASYSGLRSGELTDRDAFAMEQGMLIDQDTTPEFEAWLLAALTAGAINLPLAKIEKFKRHEFWGRTWMWVDPTKQHAAQLLQYQLGRTLESIHQENGWPANEVEPRTPDQIFGNPAFMQAAAQIAAAGGEGKA